MPQASRVERTLLAEVLEREFRHTYALLRAYPAEQLGWRPEDCPRSGRELAWAFVERERRLHYLIGGRASAEPAPVSTGLHPILAAYEAAHRETARGLGAMSDARWEETLRGPAGDDRWERGRRAELLWLAVRDAAHHREHFALHLRLAREAEAGRRRTGASLVPAA